MASHMALLITAAMAVVLVGALLPATASATVYRVGDEDGWVVDKDYNAWASEKDFQVGDSLEFVCSTEEEPASNVLQVDEARYVACTVLGKALKLTQGTEDEIVKLSAAGQFFLISDVEDDCNKGI